MATSFFKVVQTILLIGSVWSSRNTKFMNVGCLRIKRKSINIYVTNPRARVKQQIIYTYYICLLYTVSTYEYIVLT